MGTEQFSVVMNSRDVALNGSIQLPGSKSLTNRALLLAALARGESHITGALKSDDTHFMASALRKMGVRIGEPDERAFIVESVGHLAPPDGPLFLGNAGTAVRFLTAAAALVQGDVEIDGDAYMRRRPISPLLKALQSCGVNATGTAGCPPITIRGDGTLQGGRWTVDASLSSQYLSAMLMIAPLAAQDVRIELDGAGIGARGYVDLTVAIMRAFGAEISQVSQTVWDIKAGAYRAAEYWVEPDASAATYIWAANALSTGAVNLVGETTEFTQPDANARSLISRFPDLPAEIDGSQMQDAMPTIAVLSAFGRNKVRLYGLENLRVKECDRVQALYLGLNRIKPGLAAIEGDELIITPLQTPEEAAQDIEIDSFSDHRIAMSFALAGLRLNGIKITDAGCVAKTYPDYWTDLKSLGASFVMA